MASSLCSDLKHNSGEWLKLSLPALLYTIQNNALFLGLANLEAAVAQVTYQGKIFTTAMFSICLLGRRLRAGQWLALVMLVLGMLCVQGIPEKLAASPAWAGQAGRRLLSTHGSAATGSSATSATSATTYAAASAESDRVALVGVIAMLVACVCSSFAGVYFEMMLKQSSASLWLRNIQLGVWATAIAAITALGTPDPLFYTLGPLHGFGPVTWAVVGANAFGGLLVAVTIKYADNILRGFAQAVALIVGAVGSHVIFAFAFTRDFLLGVCFVICAIFLYGGTCDTQLDSACAWRRGGTALSTKLADGAHGSRDAQPLLGAKRASNLEADDDSDLNSD